MSASVNQQSERHAHGTGGSADGRRQRRRRNRARRDRDLSSRAKVGKCVGVGRSVCNTTGLTPIETAIPDT